MTMQAYLQQAEVALASNQSILAGFSADEAALNTHLTQMMNIINLEMGMATAVRGGAMEAYEQHLAPYTVALDAHIIGLQAASAQWEFSIAEQQMEEARGAREEQQRQRKRGLSLIHISEPTRPY